MFLSLETSKALYRQSIHLSFEWRNLYVKHLFCHLISGKDARWLTSLYGVYCDGWERDRPWKVNVFVVSENVIHASDDFRYDGGMVILLGLPPRMLWIWIDLYRPFIILYLTSYTWWPKSRLARAEGIMVAKYHRFNGVSRGGCRISSRVNKSPTLGFLWSRNKSMMVEVGEFTSLGEIKMSFVHLEALKGFWTGQRKVWLDYWYHWCFSYFIHH